MSIYIQVNAVLAKVTNHFVCFFAFTFRICTYKNISVGVLSSNKAKKQYIGVRIKQALELQRVFFFSMIR